MCFTIWAHPWGTCTTPTLPPQNPGKAPPQGLDLTACLLMYVHVRAHRPLHLYVHLLGASSCVTMCVCVYTYIHIYIYIYMCEKCGAKNCVRASVCACLLSLCVCVCVCMCSSIHTYINRHRHADEHESCRLNFIWGFVC